MKQRCNIIYVLFFFLTLFVVEAQAGIAVSTMRINIAADKSLHNGELNNYKEITVTNTGDKVEYVVIKPHRLHFPGEKRQKKEYQEMVSPIKFGLVLSRQKLIIPPKQSRVVRLMPLIHNNKQDIVYGVTVVPAARSFAKMRVPKHTVLSGISIVMGYEIGVILRPLNPKPIITMGREGRKLTLKNTGNTNVLFYKGKQCLGKQCKPLPDHRLYAGNTWHYNLPFNTKVSYLERYPDHKKTVSI